MAAEFRAPASIEEALQDLGAEGAVAVGGGTQVGLLLRQGLIEPARLVWLGRLASLREIGRDADGSLLVGAGATLAEIAGSPLVRSALPALAAAAARVGNARVRAVATVGGHLMHADPRQDLPPTLLVLGAAVLLEGRAGAREVPLREFFRGPFETAANEGELLTGLRVPVPGGGARCRYERFTPGTPNDYPTVGVAALVEPAGDAVRRALIGLAGVGPRPLLLLVELPRLAARPDAAMLAEVGERVASACDPTSDQRGSADYKRAMAGLWARRALRSCLEAQP